MKNDYTTVGGVANFPVSDITHKPKRMQGDMIKLMNRQVPEEGESDPVKGATPETLKVVTLERAITYYKSMSADTVNGELYRATAKWLEELLVTRTSKTEAARKAVSKEGMKEDADKES